MAEFVLQRDQWSHLGLSDVQHTVATVHTVVGLGQPSLALVRDENTTYTSKGRGYVAGPRGSKPG
jgi:hypothetical protein